MRMVGTAITVSTFTTVHPSNCGAFLTKSAPPSHFHPQPGHPQPALVFSSLSGLLTDNFSVSRAVETLNWHLFLLKALPASAMVKPLL